MKIQEILNQKDGSVVDTLLCRVVRVYDPNDPSPAQQKHGIHSQDLVVKDDTGECKLQFMRPGQHVGKELEGQLITVSSSEDENGRIDGVRVSEYKGKTKVVCGNGARISRYKAGKDIERPARDKSRPSQDTDAPTLDDRLAALARHHRNCYEHVKTAYGDTVPPETLLATASCLFIETKSQVRVEPTAPPQHRREPTLEERYDQLAEPLMRKHGREAVDWAHDYLVKLKGGTEAAYQTILNEPGEFTRMVELRVEQEAK